ncbi:hypothetical protein BLNAU_17276 [Blattamonas nauphoetae]|uniref:WW domain-containing protein n=1 Tax=Blattamonas nauphoetae TaxID=2049346 RepID=A0ABQ9XAT3_9EUKA|nr:hypothetical protein BLNAU_17276 [Blattamonas nauphoetae]
MEPQLPENWRSSVNPKNNRRYYYNVVTKEKSYNPPPGTVFPSSGEGEELPPGWECKTDQASGKVYYFNRATRQLSWTRPAGSPPPAHPSPAINSSPSPTLSPSASAALTPSISRVLDTTPTTPQPSQPLGTDPIPQFAQISDPSLLPLLPQTSHHPLQTSLQPRRIYPHRRQIFLPHHPIFLPHHPTFPLLRLSQARHCLPVLKNRPYLLQVHLLHNYRHSERQGSSASISGLLQSISSWLTALIHVDQSWKARAAHNLAARQILFHQISNPPSLHSRWMVSQRSILLCKRLDYLRRKWSHCPNCWSSNRLPCPTRC